MCSFPQGIKSGAEPMHFLVTKVNELKERCHIYSSSSSSAAPVEEDDDDDQDTKPLDIAETDKGLATATAATASSVVTSAVLRQRSVAPKAFTQALSAGR
jgi:hypothetical protein